MFKDKNKGFSTLTVILLVINIALAVLIGVSWFRDTQRQEEEILPGLIVTPSPGTPSPAAPGTKTPKPSETTTPAPAPVTPAPSAYPKVQKDPEGRRPDYADFDWYFSDVKNNGIWADAETITNLGEVLGDWKAYILYDPERTGDEACEMLFNLKIDAGQNNIELLCDWYYIRYFKDEEPSYEDNDSTFRGSWNEGSIDASGPGTLHISGFYERDGRQYALGSMTAKDGTPADLVLKRP